MQPACVLKSLPMDDSKPAVKQIRPSNLLHAPFVLPASHGLEFSTCPERYFCGDIWTRLTTDRTSRILLPSVCWFQLLRIHGAAIVAIVTGFTLARSCVGFLVCITTKHPDKLLIRTTFFPVQSVKSVIVIQSSISLFVCLSK